MLQACSYNISGIKEQKLSELVGSLYNAKVFVRFDSESVMTCAGTPEAMVKAQKLYEDACKPEKEVPKEEAPQE